MLEFPLSEAVKARHASAHIRIQIRFRTSPERLAHPVGAIARQRERLYSCRTTEDVNDRFRLDVVAPCPASNRW